MEEKLRAIVIQELSLHTHSREEADVVIARLGGIIMAKTLQKITDDLSDDDAILFDALIQEGEKEGTSEVAMKYIAFIDTHVPHLEEVVASMSREALEEYRKTQAQVL